MKGILIGCGGGAYHGLGQMRVVGWMLNVEEWLAMDDDWVTIRNWNRQWSGKLGNKAALLREVGNVLGMDIKPVQVRWRYPSDQPEVQKGLEQIKQWGRERIESEALVVVLADTYTARVEGWRLAMDMAQWGFGKVGYATAGCDEDSGWALCQWIVGGTPEYPTILDVMPDIVQQAQKEQIEADRYGGDERLGGQFSCGSRQLDGSVAAMSQIVAQTAYANGRTVVEMWRLVVEAYEIEQAGCLMSVWHKPVKR